ncbi:MAG: membrane protein insertase YidC [Kiloniellales bacterium]
MDQRNLFLAIALSLAIMIGFQYFMPPAVPPEAPQTATDTTPGAPSAPAAPGEPASVPTLPGAPAPAQVDETATRAEAMAQGERVTIRSPRLSGSIALKGARFDDLILTEYHETIEPSSPNIELLQPVGVAEPYYAAFGWTTGDTAVKVPDADSLWQSDSSELAPGKPVTLTWDNGAGLTFEQTIELDDNYLFAVTQRVVNSSGGAAGVAPYGFISRSGTPPVLGFYILHEGLIGVFDGTLKEVDYSDLQDEKRIQQSATTGWIGITDKYWQVALIPDQKQTVNSRFVYNQANGQDKYQTDVLYPVTSVAAGSESTVTSRLFAGAKLVKLLDRYEEQYNIDRFDLSVDFGWFYFLTKPIFYALHYFHQILGNFGLAILALTILIKLVFFPLANKSYKAMAKMRKLQPELVKLRERYPDDKQRLNQEMMALYKREGANPMSGCLPILVQIPVFFALYKVMFVSIEMRHAPFYGWIQDLSAPDPTSVLNGFGLFPWDVPELGFLHVLNIGVWPLIMGCTMFLQQRLNPQPTDPVQAKIFMFMPIMFTFLLGSFPAGLVIYWTWNNLLSIAQQMVIMRQQGVSIRDHKQKT